MDASRELRQSELGDRAASLLHSTADDAAAHRGREHRRVPKALQLHRALHSVPARSSTKSAFEGKNIVHLVDRPDAAGLAIDMVGGVEPVESGLDAFIQKRETDFLG